MKKTKNDFKIVVIAALVAAITLLHYRAIPGHPGLHILHRELYFLPILLASFWFGLKVGLSTAAIVSLIYVPHVFVYNDSHGSLLTVASQIVVFNLVAVVLGWLTDRQRRQQQEVFAAENLAVLGRASVAVGYEMADLLTALKSMTHQVKGLKCTELDRDFHQEMARLEAMVKTLSSFAPEDKVELLSRDLNDIIGERVQSHQEAAEKAGVYLKALLDERGCPSRLDIERITWVLDNIIKNGLEVSRPGQTITVSSKRGGHHCRVEVRDQGPGIKPEHLEKIFVPFFTTKNKGTGLALAGCKKIINDLGGDIQVSSKYGEGATFTVAIPRDES
jgi:signal transduction histidine kinase